MASTHYKRLTVAVRPSATVSDFPLLVYFNADADIGARISNVNELRFFTTGGTGLDWMDVSLDLAGGEVTGWARVVAPTVLSSADHEIDVRYGGTPVASGGPSSTLSLTGLVGAWDMETTSPSDWSGNAYNGTASGTVGTATGKIGSAVDFGGGYINDVGGVAAFSFFQNTGVFSIGMWLKFDDADPANNNYSLFDSSGVSSSNKGFSLFFENRDVVGAPQALRVVAYRGAGGGNTVFDQQSSTAIITDTNWHHIAVTADGTDIKWYIDGSLDSTDSSAIGTLSTGNSSLTAEIGRPNAAIWPMAGLIDDVRVYSTTHATSIAYQVAQTNSPGTWGSEQVVGAAGGRNLILGCGIF